MKATVTERAKELKKAGHKAKQIVVILNKEGYRTRTGSRITENRYYVLLAKAGKAPKQPNGLSEAKLQFIGTVLNSNSMDDAGKIKLMRFCVL